jgi:hypothetical protein
MLAGVQSDVDVDDVGVCAPPAPQPDGSSGQVIQWRNGNNRIGQEASDTGLARPTTPGLGHNSGRNSQLKIVIMRPPQQRADARTAALEREQGARIQGEPGAH